MIRLLVTVVLAVSLFALASAVSPTSARAQSTELQPAWPLPIPKWFWSWAQWYLGRSEFKGDPRNSATRPPAAPREIPWWGWQRLLVILGNPPEKLQLPQGGRDLLPTYRIVSFFGAPQNPRLGVLGIGSLQTASSRLRRQTRPYRSPQRPVMRAFELIAVIASASAGPDGNFSFRQPDKIIRRHLDEARRAGALLILDIQPGRASFLDEAKRLEKFLEQPDVGLALDPEWSMRAGEIPGQVIGSTNAAIVNGVSGYLAGLVEEHDLPEKLLVVHQFTNGMVKGKPNLIDRPGIALVMNVDGFGTRFAKISKYDFLTGQVAGLGFHHGIKLFFEEDINLLRPAQVLGLNPQPDVVIYE